MDELRVLVFWDQRLGPEIDIGSGGRVTARDEALMDPPAEPGADHG